MAIIKKILIANRGEIAVRIIRTAKIMGIQTVVIYHEIDAQTLPVREADEAFEVFGATPVAAYLDIGGILAICRRTGADAVHPGFGFLAENASFARACSDAGLIFIGPDSKVISLMGDKVKAREFIINKGFPVAPSAIEENDPAVFLENARKIGSPLLIKAAAGGGGKGMRIIRDLAELEMQIDEAKSESLRYFGDDRIYCERYIDQPRHIEVQIFGDHKGNVIHLWERECSIQRRFQKIIEETPSPALSPSQREQICSTAVEIARAANYVNAGTIEFIMSPDGKFYFLEMNTRLQVEHPVTEMVTGFDLVALQINIAAGESLGILQEDIHQTGHAFECRIYAEDPDNQFMPAIGEILLLKPPVGPGVRFDCGLTSGSSVTSAFDPMIAKVIVHGQNRQQAILRTRQALRDTVLLGLTTNTAYLERIMAHPDFMAGKLHTHFLEERQDALKGSLPDDKLKEMLLAAANLADRHTHQAVCEVLEPYRSMGAWRN